MSTALLKSYSYLNVPAQPVNISDQKEDSSKTFVDKKKQKAVEVKKEIDRILEDMPSVVAKGFEEHKYILDC